MTSTTTTTSSSSSSADHREGHCLVDYVFSYGLSLDPASLREYNYANTNSSTIKHPLDQRFSPQLQIRYPPPPLSLPPQTITTSTSANDTSTTANRILSSIDASISSSAKDPFPGYLEMFSFPNGIQLLTIDEQRSADTLQSTLIYHSFVTTDSYGQRSYGVCLTAYQPLAKQLHRHMQSMISAWTTQNFQSSDIEYATHIQRKLNVEQKVYRSTSDETVHELIHLYRGLLEPYKKALMSADELYAPICVGILSKWPVYGLFRDWLVKLLGGLMKDGELAAPLERYIVSLAHELNVPPQGRISIDFDWDALRFSISRPPLNCIPLIRDFPLAPLFRALSVENVIRLFELIIMEQKILLVSQSTALLSLVADALLILLYPLYWQHIYIPVLPAKLLNCLQAPVPFIIGVQDSILSSCPADCDLLPRDVAIVRLDSNSIENTELMDEQLAPKIFQKERRKLAARLKKYSRLQTTGFQQPGSVDRIDLNRPRFWTAKRLQEDEDKLSALSIIERNFINQFQRLREEQDRLAAAFRKQLPPVPHSQSLPKGTKSAATGESGGSTDFLRFLKVLQRPSSTTSLQSAVIASDIDITRCGDSKDTVHVEDGDNQPSLEHSGELTATTNNANSSNDIDYLITTGTDQLQLKTSGSSSIGNSSLRQSPASSNREATENSPARLLSDMTSKMARQVSGILDKASNKLGAFGGGGGGANLNSRRILSQQSSKTTIAAEGEDVLVEGLLTSTNAPEKAVDETSSVVLVDAEAAEVRVHDVFHYYPLPSLTNQSSFDETSGSKLSHIWCSYVPPAKRYQYLLDCDAIGVGGNGGKKLSSSSSSTLQLCTLLHHPGEGKKYEAQTEVEGHRLMAVLAVYTGHSNATRGDTLQESLSSAFYGTAVTNVQPNGGDNYHNSQPVAKSSSDLHALMSNLRLLKRTDSRGLLEKSSYLVPSSLSIGLCAVCDQEVPAPLVLADGKVYTTKGLASFQEIDKADSINTGHSDALVCHGCRLLVHRKCAPTINDYCRCAFDDLKVQESFFRLWTSILRSYRTYLIPCTDKTPGQSAINAETVKRSVASNATSLSVSASSSGFSKKLARFPFITSSNTTVSGRSKPADDVFFRSEFIEQAFHDYESRLFMRRLCETQAFAKFIYDRIERPRFDYEILFFDEAINAKLNRSLIKIQKEATPFLENPAYAIHQKLIVSEPYTLRLSSCNRNKMHEYKQIPRQLDYELIKSMQKTIAVAEYHKTRLPIANGEEERRLQLYTCSILRRSRIDKLQKRRSDVTDWVKNRLANSAINKKDPNTPAPTADSELLAVNQQVEQIYSTVLKIAQDIETDPVDAQQKNSVSLQVLCRLLNESRERAVRASNLLQASNGRHATVVSLIAKNSFGEEEIQDISLLQSHIQHLIQSITSQSSIPTQNSS